MSGIKFGSDGTPLPTIKIKNSGTKAQRVRINTPTKPPAPRRIKIKKRSQPSTHPVGQAGVRRRKAVAKKPLDFSGYRGCWTRSKTVKMVAAEKAAKAVESVESADNINKMADAERAAARTSSPDVVEAATILYNMSRQQHQIVDNVEAVFNIPAHIGASVDEQELEGAYNLMFLKSSGGGPSVY
ncbi:MAG: hypothetical protein STHCBS139747_001883 [Sporothrix thermara]